MIWVSVAGPTFVNLPPCMRNSVAKPVSDCGSCLVQRFIVNFWLFTFVGIAKIGDALDYSETSRAFAIKVRAQLNKGTCLHIESNYVPVDLPYESAKPQFNPHQV